MCANIIVVAATAVWPDVWIKSSQIFPEVARIEANNKNFS